MSGHDASVVAISTLLLVVAVSMVVTRVATVILVATGMSRQAARFQARSAFTGAGFTTSESEAVIDHPVRRRVIAALMLAGGAGTVVVISTLIVGFSSAHSGSRAWWRVLELVVGLVALVFVSRSRWVDQRLTRTIGIILHRFTKIPARDVASLLELSRGYAVSELAVCDGDWITGRPLADLGLRDEGVVVLGVTRKDGRYLAAPTGSTVVAGGDILVVYGADDRLEELDRRAAGAAGDAAHAAAITEQQAVERSERVTSERPSAPHEQQRQSA